MGGVIRSVSMSYDFGIVRVNRGNCIFLCEMT